MDDLQTEDKIPLDKITTKEQLKDDLKREKKTQTGIKSVRNKSVFDLSSLVIKSKNRYGQNFSFSDFNKADLRGQIFVRANFSFARNLDKAIKDRSTEFFQCNFTGVIEKELPYPIKDLRSAKCNVGKLFDKFTDKEIKDLCDSSSISNT